MAVEEDVLPRDQHVVEDDESVHLVEAVGQRVHAGHGVTLDSAGDTAGADLGAEKFFDIKCRKAGLKPSAAVIVATVRAMKMNGGVAKADLGTENVEAVKKGCPNLGRHIANVKSFGVPVVVAINHFYSDTDAEIAAATAGWTQISPGSEPFMVGSETIKIDGEPNNGGRDKDRQRIRARLGAYTEINPQVDTGIRIATGGGDDARSTNQDQDNYFDKKQIWLDLGYIDYHPDAIKNLHVIGGKMLQPWVSMGDVIWDSDINPEGLALTYKYPLGSSAELFGSLVLEAATRVEQAQQLAARERERQLQARLAEVLLGHALDEALAALAVGLVRGDGGFEAVAGGLVHHRGLQARDDVAGADQHGQRLTVLRSLARRLADFGHGVVETDDAVLLDLHGGSGLGR